jgi:hypothetical protein
MAGRGSAKKVQQALDALTAAEAPLDALDAARLLREAAEDLELSKVAELRKEHISWAKIGTLYGTTKQGAQQRFGRVAD